MAKFFELASDVSRWEFSAPEELLPFYNFVNQIDPNHWNHAFHSPDFPIAYWSTPERSQNSIDWREQSNSLAVSDLGFALGLARSLWENAECWPETVKGVGAFAIFGDLTGDGSSELEIEIEDPVLALVPGSVSPLVIRGLLKLPRWVIGLFVIRKAGIAPSNWANYYVTTLRKYRAKSNDGASRDLLTISDLSSKALDGKWGVIVLLHGLFSTDVGTFDTFIGSLMSHSWAREKLVVVGWPHDTLRGIEDNAQELEEEINLFIGDSGLNVAFVAHSRGGLLARKVSTILLKQKRNDWRSRLKGLVTFGTPHEGASLAESPECLIGIVATLQSYECKPAVWPMILMYYRAQKEIQGILDLQPLGAKHGGFQARLRQSESDTCTKKHAAREIEILAIGGEVFSDATVARLASKALAHESHDLVVPTNSSMPKTYENTFRTSCSHTGYFSGGEDSSHQRAIEFLDERLEIGMRLIKEQATAKPNSGFLENWEWDPETGTYYPK